MSVVNDPLVERKAFSIWESARYAGIGRSTLYQLIGKGVIPTLKVGRRRLILRATLDAWLEEREH